MSSHSGMMQFRSLHDLDRTEGTVQLREPSNANGGPSTLVLLPHPSPIDPNDPLRWPAWKKHAAFACVCAFTFLTNFAIGGLAPAFYPLSLEFHKSLTETSDLLLWPILVLGIFNFFWVPTANYIGKRPVFVFATGLLCVAYIWGATAQTFKSLLWSNIVAAFAGSSTEAVGASIVNDVYFLHERSNKMSIYMLAIAGGNSLGPLICGFIVQNLSWRWHKWLAVILTALNFLAVIFFVPETRYDRDFSKSLDVADHVALALPSAAMDDPTFAFSAKEKGVQSKTTGTITPTSSDSGSDGPIQLPKKTYLQQLSLWSGTPVNTNLVRLFFRPFPLIVYPAVFYAFLGYAVSLAWVVAINILNSFILEAPPFNWGAATDGLINIPGIIGNAAGSFAGGWCVDKYCDWRARKNGGVFQPETRLVLLVLSVLVVPAGCILFGYGVQEQMSWTTLFFGYGMVSFGLCAVPTITMTYVSDSYLPVAPDALLLVNGLKNIVAFGFLYGVVPWVDKTGYVNAFGTQAGVFVAILALGLPLWYFGEKIRHVTGKWKIIL